MNCFREIISNRQYRYRCNVCNINFYKEILSNPQYRCNVCNIECCKEIISNLQYRCNVCNIECYKELAGQNICYMCEVFIECDCSEIVR